MQKNQRTFIYEKYHITHSEIGLSNQKLKWIISKSIDGENWIYKIVDLILRQTWIHLWKDNVYNNTEILQCKNCDELGKQKEKLM